MKTPVLLLIAASLLTVGAAAQTRRVESVYTGLKAEKCKTIELSSDHGGDYSGRCAGTGNYKLEVLEGDLRQTINVIAPGSKKFELNLTGVVSNGFSSIGETAEWRVARKNGKLIPTALIVRYNASEEPADASKITSYLVVVKITAEAVCVTDTVKPAPDANEAARRLADESADKACKAAPN